MKEWTDERIDSEVEALHISMSYDLRVVGLMRRIRDELTASHAAELNNVLVTSTKAIEVLNSEAEHLRKDSLMLQALRQSGVDNWEGYSEAFSLLREWQDNEHS